MFSAYYVFLRERSYFIFLDIKNLVNAICKEYTAKHNNKNSATLRGIQKEKEIKIIVFKAVLFYKVKKNSETVLMGILKICGNWPITNFHSTVTVKIRNLIYEIIILKHSQLIFKTELVKFESKQEFLPRAIFTISQNV